MNISKEQWQRIISIVLGAALAVFAVLGWVIEPATFEQPEARLREKISIDARDDALLYNGADLVMYSDDHATQKFTVDGATGNVTGSGVVSTGAITHTGFLVEQPATSITVTQDITITPGGTYQPIVAAGAVSTGVIVNPLAGRRLVLINTGSNAITISDTGTVMLGGDRVLGQYDALSLIGDGTNWIEVALGNN